MKSIYSIQILILLFSCSPKESNTKLNHDQIQLGQVTGDTLRNDQSDKIYKNKMTDQELIENIKLAINPKFKDWVIFKNGTYIIFDDIKK